jgi:ssDNA-binding Zn-finger/Zn-ribbon topoisomerase 1
MTFIDAEYLNLASASLLKFSKKKPSLYNFRCPYCGDSTRNRNKARGYMFVVKGSFVYKCHNCGVGRSFPNFLKENFPHLYDEYILEKYKEGATGKGTYVPAPEFNFQKPEFFSKDENSETLKNVDLPTIQSLNTTHPAREYLTDRKIPEKYFSQLYYAEDYNAWAKTNNKYKEARIIIPLLTPDGKLFGHQGRSLDKNSKLRYITSILDESYPKLFGLDRLDTTKTIYITEGPFDSLFLSNGIAMCGADVSLDIKIYPDRVFVYDNEPRNKEIVKRYESTISRGEKVVIYPDGIVQKDINDMIMAGLNVQDMIKCNTFSGLEAQLKFNNWKKV